MKRNFGAKAKANMVEFAELAEDSPIASLWNGFIHQLFGWPGYLLFNLTGQEYGGAKGMKITHFYFGEDSVFFKPHELKLILLSDVGVATMIGALIWAGQVFGSWNVIVLWGIPWLWVNNWIGKSITVKKHEEAKQLTMISSCHHFPSTHRRFYASLRQQDLDFRSWCNGHNRS